MLIARIESSRGLHRVQLRPAKRGRTLTQNAYLWGVVYPAVLEGLEDRWGESMTIDDVHAWMKARFLSEPVVNRLTGEVVGERPGSSGRLSVDQFCQYLDKVIRWARDELGVIVPPAA